MKVLSNLEFKNSTYILSKFTEFPENPVEGMTIFLDNGLYVYSTNIKSGQLEWNNILDFTRTNTSYKFEQTTENTEWVIEHNLNTQDLFVIVYDSDGNKQIESEIQFQSDNEVKLIFSEAISGKALLFGASVISSPSNIYTKEEINELLKNISGGSGNMVLPEGGSDGQVLVKDSGTDTGLNWSDKAGKSAYEIAKDTGFDGTEDEWVESLKGVNGISYGNYSGIDFTNPTTYTEVTEDDNYYYINVVSEIDGYVTYSASTLISSTAAGQLFLCVLNDTNIYASPIRHGISSYSTFVSKGDVIKLQVTKLNVTSATLSINIYPYKQANTYSTDEQVIGTWIDGKPIYRKVVETTLPNSSDPMQLDIFDLSLEKLIKIDSIANEVGKFYMQVPSSTVSGDIYITINIPNILKIFCSNSYWYGKPVTVILEYTKTAD